MKKSAFARIIEEVFTLDLRALALFRIGIALTLIIDLVLRFTDLEAHYSNTGVLPLEALFRMVWDRYYFSLYTFTGSWQIESIVFIINIICAFCLLVGYRTKIFSIICWIFIVSLHNRNPLIQQAGDDLLRLLVFWGMFLPWGYLYSIDSYKYFKPFYNTTKYVSIAGVAYICQVAFLYVFSALLKSSPEWTTDFTAIYYALSLDQILTPLGKLLYPYGSLLKTLTASVYYTELLLPFILFIPFKNSFFRMAFIIIMTSVHIGINLCLNVGLFSWICIVAMIGFIPKQVLDKVIDRYRLVLYRLKYKIKDIVTILVKQEAEPAPSPLRLNILSETFVFFIFIYSLAWNIGTVKRKPVPDNIQWIGHFLRVDQFWGMFAPAVFKDDGWFVLLGKTVDGREINIARKDLVVDYSKPVLASTYYKNDRWRKYHENMLLVNHAEFRPYYTNYLLDHWNAKHKDKNFITRFELVYMKEVSQPDYRLVVPKRQVLSIVTAEAPHNLLVKE